MKKCLALVLAVILAGVWCVGAYASYWNEGNDGDSWETAYIIDSVEDFVMMHDRAYGETGKYYKLTTDIDLSSYTDWEGRGFSGHFDGQNHTITVNISSDEEACLFSVVDSEGIAIRNLNVSGTVHAEGNTSGYPVSAAGIVLQMKTGIMENCRFDGTVEAIGGQDTRSTYAGGLLRFIYEGAIVRDCIFHGDVTSSGYDAPEAAGIVCATVDDDNVTIERCSVLSGSTIRANDLSSNKLYLSDAGGIVGLVDTNNSTIADCVVEASIEGNASDIGGIAGCVFGEGNTLSGNTWPSGYDEAGYITSGNTQDDSGNVVPDQPGDVQQVSSEDVDYELPSGIVEPVTPIQTVVENIADALSVDVEDIHYLSADNITEAKDPTTSMTDYVHEDGYEIAGKLNTITVDTEGWYVFRVNLTDELYAVMKDQDISDFTFYALNDDEESDAGVAILPGLLNTFEIFTLTGEKMDTFGTKEFLMAGLLDAGTPFSVYIAKILLALLAGGCNSGVTIGGVAICIVLAVKLLRRH